MDENVLRRIRESLHQMQQQVQNAISEVTQLVEERTALQVRMAEIDRRLNQIDASASIDAYTAQIDRGSPTGWPTTYVPLNSPGTPAGTNGDPTTIHRGRLDPPPSLAGAPRLPAPPAVSSETLEDAILRNLPPSTSAAPSTWAELRQRVGSQIRVTDAVRRRLKGLLEKMVTRGDVLQVQSNGGPVYYRNNSRPTVEAVASAPPDVEADAEAPPSGTV